MLACVLAAAMSSGDAFQVTVAGLFSQNIYRVFIVKPTRQSWGGFLLFLGACAACVLSMALLLAA